MTDSDPSRQIVAESPSCAMCLAAATAFVSVTPAMTANTPSVFEPRCNAHNPLSTIYRKVAAAQSAREAAVVSAPLARYPLTHEALRVDDNPRHLPVVHVTDIAAERWHRCAPRIRAECRACGGEYNLCDAGGADVDALMTQAWLCPQCRQARP